MLEATQDWGAIWGHQGVWFMDIVAGAEGIGERSVKSGPKLTAGSLHTRQRRIRHNLRLIAGISTACGSYDGGGHTTIQFRSAG